MIIIQKIRAAIFGIEKNEAEKYLQQEASTCFNIHCICYFEIRYVFWKIL